MYSATNYLWGWIAYGAGAFCILGVLWYLLRNLKLAAFRHILLLLVAAVLLTPVEAYTDDPHLAPALFVSVFEAFTAEVEGAYNRGLAPILAVASGLLLIYLVARLGIRLVRGKSGAAKERSQNQTAKKAAA